MKKLTALLVAALFSLAAAIPASAAPADDSLVVAPVAAKTAKPAKKHKQVRKAKHKRTKARAHKRQRRL